MLAAVASCWALFLGLGFLMIGNGLQGSLLGVRAELEGFPTTVTGLLMSAYYVGFLAGSLATPKLVNRVGHARVFAALGALASIAILVHALVIEPLVWSAMRLLTGISYAGLYVVAESWLNAQASNQTRGQLLSVYMVVLLGGMAIGQVLLNLASPAGPELFMLVALMVSCGLIPILLSASHAPAISQTAPIGLIELYRVSRTGVVGYFGTGISQGSVFGMGAVYATSQGLSVAEVGLFMGLILIGGIIVQWPIGWLSDRFERRRVLAAVTFAAAACALFADQIPMAGGGWRWPVLLLFGAAIMPMYSLSLACANDHLAPAQRVSASGSLMLIGGAGAILGPILVAGGMDLISARAFFWCLVVVHSAIGLFALRQMLRRAAPIASSFAALPPGATPQAGAMHAAASSEGSPGPTRPRDDGVAGMAAADRRAP